MVQSDREDKVHQKYPVVSLKFITISTIVFVFFTLFVLWLFTVLTSSGNAQAADVDETRVLHLRKIKRNIENYAATQNFLPESLRSLIKTKGSLMIKDPETDEEYDYDVIDENTYKLCAVFATESPVGGAEVDPSFRHKEGRQCFSFFVNFKRRQYDYYDYLYPTYSYYTPFPTPTPMIIEDEKIESVTTNVLYEISSNFPYGFFSDNENEYGIINYHDEPVSVTVTFKEPEVLTQIENVFAACSGDDCFIWNAVGVTEEGKNETIVKEVKSSTTSYVSLANITSTAAYEKVIITVKRGGDGHIHWNKIRFTYK